MVESREITAINLNKDDERTISGTTDLSVGAEEPMRAKPRQSRDFQPGKCFGSIHGDTIVGRIVKVNAATEKKQPKECKLGAFLDSLGLPEKKGSPSTSPAFNRADSLSHEESIQILTKRLSKAESSAQFSHFLGFKAQKKFKYVENFNELYLLLR